MGPEVKKIYQWKIKKQKEKCKRLTLDQTQEFNKNYFLCIETIQNIQFYNSIKKTKNKEADFSSYENNELQKKKKKKKLILISEAY